MLPWIASQTVIRLRGTSATDDYNNTEIVFTSPAQQTIDGCSVQPLAGDEYNEGRDAITTRWRWFGPPDADVTSVDRIRWRGSDYEVDGSVEEWEDPLGGMDYKAAVLRKIDG